MARRSSAPTRFATTTSPVTSNASARSASLFSNWLARAFTTKRRSDLRRISARSSLHCETLETRVMLDNQPPVITAATAPAYTIWHTATTFAGANAFSISDPDAGNGIVQATLTAATTVFWLSQTTGLTFSEGDGAGDWTMTFRGTISDINAALDGMVLFVGDVTGNINLSLTVNDLGNSGAGGAKTATSNVSWNNTFMEFNSSNGVLKLYGLETGEESIVIVRSTVNVLDEVFYTVNGVEHATGISRFAVTEVRISLRSGDDSFLAAPSAGLLKVRTIDAGAGNDYVNAAPLWNELDNLEIFGQQGSNTILGSQGDDKIYLSTDFGGNAYGREGNDTIYGSNSNDLLDGGEGDDTIHGGSGNDRYILRDRFFLNAPVWQGTDRFFELPDGGDDTLDFSVLTSSTDLTIDLQSTAAQVVSSGLNLQLNDGSTFENVIGGAGNDIINGNAASNNLSGLGGNDTIYGMGGADILTGGVGDDLLYGGAGDDVYIFNANVALGNDQAFELAGQGTDRLDFSETTAAVNLNIDLRSTAARVISSTLTLQLNAGNTFENVTGGAGNDSLAGNTLGNTLDGRDGNDVYYGFQGNDTYVGSGGNDTYFFDADIQLNSDAFVGIDAGVDIINLYNTTTLGTTLNLSLFNAIQAVNSNLSLNISNNTIIENILGTNQADNYTGNAADNQFDLWGGDDIAVGLAGNDRFIGGAGNDSLSGGNDDDIYVFNASTAQGIDQLFEAAGGGTDALDLSATAATTNLTIDLRSNLAQVVAPGLTLTLNVGAAFENVFTGAGNDTIFGNASGNALGGGAGNDLLYGGLGDDVYYFNASVAQGSDQVFELAGQGTDRLDFSVTTSTVNLIVDLRSTLARILSPGLTLQLNSGSTFENVIGGAGNDTLIGNALSNRLDGRDGNDQYYGFQGNDTYDGSRGNDTYFFDADTQLNSDAFVGDDAGVDTINLFNTTTLGTTLNLGLLNTAQAVNANLTLSINDAVTLENIIGTNLVDNYIGNAADNQFELYGGDDIGFGLSGNDRLTGGAGNDYLNGGNDHDFYVFDADVAQGTDTLIEAATEEGGVDALDFSQTTGVTNNLNIDLRIGGVQVIRAGTVSLSLGSNNSFENVIAGAGNDTILGNELGNTLLGLSGNDTIYGFGGLFDYFYGGLGNDTYMFDADLYLGYDYITDDGGIDTLNWSETTTTSRGAFINLAFAGATQAVLPDSIHFVTLTDGESIENVIGTGGNQSDVIWGNQLNNVLTGNGGDDYLEGRGGNDTLVGGAGNDNYGFDADNVLGSDLLDESGGGDQDTLSFSATDFTNLATNLLLDGYQTIAPGNLSIRLLNPATFERVFGGRARDYIVGNAANNFLWGNDGDDIIYGQGGNDYIAGGIGNDELYGEAGRDVIIGGEGADTIDGGSESDLIIGGTYTREFSNAAPVIVSIWAGPGSYATRVAAVQAGTFPLTPGVTVLNDNVADTLRGGTGTSDDQLDLFFSSALDTLPDLDSGLETNIPV